MTYPKSFISIICLFFGIIESLYSQSDIKLSSFFLTPLTYNPAYAGSYEGLTLTSIYSGQWIGFDGAPKSLFLNGHSNVLASKVGIGFEIVRDEIGVTSETEILSDFAYHLPITKGWEVSFGIKTGGSWYAVDYNRLVISDPQELNNATGQIKNNTLILGTGVYLHNEEFYVGLGIPNLLANSFYDPQNNLLASYSSNYYLSTGYNFKLYNDWVFQPALLTRVTKGAPLNTLLAATLIWNEKFYGSANVDLTSTVGAFFGMRIAEYFFVGYSYDMSINAFNRANNGIHTLFLNFRRSADWERKRCGCYTF